MTIAANEPESPGRPRRTLTICGSAHALHDGFTDAVYVLLPIWAQSFGLSLTQVGLLKSALTLALALFQIPAGFLSERLGAKGVLACGTIVAGIGYLLAGIAGGFAGLLLALLVTGLGASVQHPLGSALVAGAYRGSGRRAALGIYNFTGDLGKMAVPPMIALGAVWIGWRESSMLYGVAGILCGIAIWIALNRYAPQAEAPTETSPTAAKGWGIHDRRGFALLSTVGFLDTATRYAFLPFLPFLLIDKGAEVANVGFAMTLVFAGGAVGKFACGLLAERIGIIRSVVITEIVTAIGIFTLPMLPLTAALAVLPIIGVALNGTSSVLYGSVADFVDEDRQARAFSLFYTVGIGSGAISPIVFGLISDSYSVPTALTFIAAMAASILLVCPFLAQRLAAVTPQDAA